MYIWLGDPYGFGEISAMTDQDNIMFDSKGRASQSTSNGGERGGLTGWSCILEGFEAYFLVGHGTRNVDPRKYLRVYAYMYASSVLGRVYAMRNIISSS